jgi:hypothetical protein
MLSYAALVRTVVSEERSASFIRVTRIDELGTTLVLTSNQRKLRRNTIWSVASYSLSPWWKSLVTPKRRFLQAPHCVASQNARFFIDTAVETLNLTWFFTSEISIYRKKLLGGQESKESSISEIRAPKTKQHNLCHIRAPKTKQHNLCHIKHKSLVFKILLSSRILRSTTICAACNGQSLLLRQSWK